MDGGTGQPGRCGEDDLHRGSPWAQYHLLCQVARKHGRRLKLLLRLTSGSQFGLERKEIHQILAQPDPQIEVRGIQYFSGTQKTSVKRLGRELRMLEEFLSSLQDQYGPIPELELGPGFPVSYFADDAEQDEEVLLQAAQQLASCLFPESSPWSWDEASPPAAGTYVTRVVDRKTNQSQNYAIVDGGIHQLVYFGQSMAMRRPQVELLPYRDGDGVENWNICGSLCTVNDILVKQLPLSRLEVGDVLAFGNAGAYCMTEGISLFLSRDLPAYCCAKRTDRCSACAAPFRPAPGIPQIMKIESETIPWNSCLKF